MKRLQAARLCIVAGVESDPKTKARADRLIARIDANEIEYVDDARLNEIVPEEVFGKPSPHHGAASPFKPLIFLNRFRFGDTAKTRADREAAFPALFRNPTFKFQGYGGLEWRESGSPAYRERTGTVCQPAYQLHTIVGCPFRCAYCSLGYFYNLMLNIEDFLAELDRALPKIKNQTLYQYDNWTDTVCFEPEYGGTQLMIEYFAKQDERYLELYVGKSDNVDFILDLDHKSHTVCCWSVAGKTQTEKIELETASQTERIDAARKCQEAGYPIRYRLSPIIPVKNWREENRELIENIFATTRPDIVTFETLRFMDYDKIVAAFDPDILDAEFLATMKEAKGSPHTQGCEIPDAFRHKIYRFIIDEIERVSPATHYALCRGKRTTWELFADDFARHDQTPDDYVCNCAATSSPNHPRLRCVAS